MKTCFFLIFPFPPKIPNLPFRLSGPVQISSKKMKAILIQIDYYSRFSPYYFHIEDLTYDDVDGAEG